MKKFIIVVTLFIVLYLGWDYAYYQLGWYVDFNPNQKVSSMMSVEGKKIFQTMPDGQKKEFEIRGVDMGVGMPGEWATDFAIDKESYMRWFEQIQAMGANTIRVYIVQSPAFYEAFYEYNKDRKDPLYLLHGVWVNDYVQFSHEDAFSEEFRDSFIKDCRSLVDVIHGNKKISLGRQAKGASGSYRYDISPWVIGYILGVEWESETVAYTNEKYKGVEGYTSYQGDFVYTSKEASPFEVMLAEVGDDLLEYESRRYKEQRLLAYSNWPATDPLVYPPKTLETFKKYFVKCARVDVEHIKLTERVISGQFASYHVYPYYPDYLLYLPDWSELPIDKEDYRFKNGKINTYRAYLALLNKHHTMPVVISEFGVSTGRGIARHDKNTGRNQGHMTEQAQGQAIIDCWKDIKATGCNGGCIFSWQDEWFKRTWNTMYAVDLKRTPYWSDYQTNEQYFGLLSFDPGKEQSVCYVDGDVSEWSEEDVVCKQNGMSISMKADEKFMYLRVNKKDLKFGKETIYIPIDTTQKTGSNYCEKYNLRFDRAADFLLVIHGKQDSRLLVQDRYDALRSTYAMEVAGENAYTAHHRPDKDSPNFVPIELCLQTVTLRRSYLTRSETFETGRLTYGDANPAHQDFNNLADFICEGDDIEIKLPWLMLNFSDPSKSEIHDDYYDGNYGVAYQDIDRLYLGVGNDSKGARIHLNERALEDWGNTVTYHERLKRSYDIVQEYWTAS